MDNHSFRSIVPTGRFFSSPRPLRPWAAAMALALLLLAAGAGLGLAKLTISVIDVGHGDAILVQFPNGQEMLVDAGKQGAGAQVVAYLQKRGVKDLELLVATHPDEDHIGGIPAVLASGIPVAKAWVSGYEPKKPTGVQKAFAAALQQQVTAETPVAGEQISFGAATVTVVAPLALRSFSNVNDNSVVLMVCYGKTSALLPGDMEEKERASVPSWRETTVLKVAHHGSENGTDRTFLQALKPTYAVISDDKEEGHGSQPVGPLLKSELGQYYSTASYGTVIFTSDGTSFKCYPTRVPATTTITAPATDTNQVYVTHRGSKYHRDGCRYLGTPRTALTKAQAAAKGYTPCKACMQ